MKGGILIRYLALAMLIIVLMRLLLSIHTIDVCQRDKTYSILFLYPDNSGYRPLAYATEATMGLESATVRELRDLNIDFTSARFVSSEAQGLDRVFLDSFDLIAVGGFSYWWEDVTDEDRIALYQTETPIIASICYGVGPNASLVETLTGVWSHRNNVTVGIDVIGGSETTVKFTEYAPDALRNVEYSAGWATLINVSASSKSKMYAQAIRNDQNYPLLIFNGTKNFLLNAFTYRPTTRESELQWDRLLFLAINEIFDFIPDDILSLSIIEKPEVAVTRVGTFYVLFDQRFAVIAYVLVLLMALIVRYQGVGLACKRRKLSFHVSKRKIRVAVFRMQQGILVLLAALFTLHGLNSSYFLTSPSGLWQAVFALIIVVIALRILDIRES